ncbi:MAG: hypothetical protein IKG27_01230 [Bacilli bacterium]|nr:hypothetical protein [Bacilli bacterium]
MNENIEMLEYIYKASNMGHSSTEDLLKELKDKDNKIRKLAENINKEYEKYEKESLKLLKKNKKEPKTAGAIADIMSKMNIKKEVITDNSDASIADMLIKGLTMGNIEIEKRIENFKNYIDKDILKIAKNFKKFGENYAEELKKFL